MIGVVFQELIHNRDKDLLGYRRSSQYAAENCPLFLKILKYYFKI